MAEHIWPSQVIVGDSVLKLASNVGIHTSPQTRATRRIDRSGHHWRLTLSPPVHNRADGAAAKVLYALLDSGPDSLWVHDHSYVRRGAFPAVELLTNPTFAQGITGWTATTGISATVQDRIYRATLLRADGVNTDMAIEQSVAAVQYGSYVLRVMYGSRRGTGQYRLIAGSASFLGDYLQAAQTAAQELQSGAFVARGTSVWGGVQWLSVFGVIAGDFIEIPYVSLARGLQVDAGPNALIRSNEFDNTTAWGALPGNGIQSVTANNAVAPDGTSTADTLVETSVSERHYREQSATKTAADQDWCGAIALKAGTRTFARLVIGDNGSNFASVFVNLTTGALVGAASASGTVTNARAPTPVSLGNGLWYVALVARVPASITTTNRFSVSPSIDGLTDNYLGNGSTLIPWGATYAQSSVPIRLTQTTTAATTGTSPTGGVINVKGGRAPSEGALAGALLMGDLVEITTARGPQLMKLTAPLDLNAAGLGTILVRPPLRGTVSDSAAVIVHQPMGRWIPLNPQTGWRNRAGGFMEPEPLELMEDVAPL